VAGNTLRLVFQAREGQWWAEQALPRSKREREGGRGRKHPPTRISSEGGAVGAESALPRLKRERKGGRGRKHPLTRVSSEGEAVVGVSVDKGGGGG